MNVYSQLSYFEITHETNGLTMMIFYQLLGEGLTMRQVQMIDNAYQCEGTRSDVPGWTSTEGFDCPAIYNIQAVNNTLCVNQFISNGYSENTACCFCPFGGIDTAMVVFKEVNTTEVSCLDRQNWKVTGQREVNCQVILDTNCPTFASFVADSSSGLSAGQACCSCEGGGYSGPLLGQMFRVSMLPNTESFHEMYQVSDGTITGSIYELARIVSATYGFGLYEVQLPGSSGTSAFNTKQDCIRYLSQGFMGLCLGTW